MSDRGLMGFIADKARKTFKPTEVESKLQEALSKKNWGASSSLLGDIARYTFDYSEYATVMSALWSALDQRGKNWRIVFKALTLMDFLIKNGAERVVDECRDKIYMVRTLQDFRYVDDGHDRGAGVRQKAKEVVELLNDTSAIREARKRSQALRSKFVGIGNDGRSSSRGGVGGSSSWDTVGSDGTYSSGGIGSSNRNRFGKDDDGSGSRNSTKSGGRRGRQRREQAASSNEDSEDDSDDDSDDSTDDDDSDDNDDDDDDDDDDDASDWDPQPSQRKAKSNGKAGKSGKIKIKIKAASGKSSKRKAGKKATKAASASAGNDEDFFGDFEAASDSFGDFADFGGTGGSGGTAPASTAASATVSGGNDFGDFGDFGDFETAAPGTNSGGNDFGDFGDFASGATGNGSAQAAGSNPATTTEDFFGSVTPQQSAPAPQQQENLL
eukprot:g1706.t1